MLENSCHLYKHSEEMRDLRILEELEKNPLISQRQLSQKLKMALGLTNTLLNRMARDGWIRIEGLTRRRIGYYVTPRGIAEKAKLTLVMLNSTLEQYSELKKIVGQRLSEIKHDGPNRIVFYGVGDELEIAYITVQQMNLNLVGIVEDDEKCKSQILLGYELEPVSRIAELNPEAVLITSLANMEQKRERLKNLVDDKTVCIKDICIP